jgi:hypothetical protein
VGGQIVKNMGLVAMPYYPGGNSATVRAKIWLFGCLSVYVVFILALAVNHFQGWDVQQVAHGAPKKVAVLFCLSLKMPGFPAMIPFSQQ